MTQVFITLLSLTFYVFILEGEEIKGRRRRRWHRRGRKDEKEAEEEERERQTDPIVAG